MTWNVFRIENHMHLARFFARRYEWLTKISAVTEGDLLQAGAMGIMHAATKFDPSRGWKFDTYARRWVQNAMQRMVETDGYPVGYPTNYFWRYREEAEKRSCGISLDKAGPLDDYEYTPWKEKLKAKDDSQEQALLDDERRRVMNELVASITEVCGERNAAVLVRRSSGECLEAIGNDIGVTRERVRQIYNETLAKCRTLPVAKRARQLLESA